MNKQLTLDELKGLNSKPVWCHIPSDNPCWGIVDVANESVVLGLNHLLGFKYYGEWKAFSSPDPIPLPTIKPKELLNQYQIAVIRTLWELAQGRIDALYTPVVAEGEKVAVEELMIRVYPESVWSEVVRAGSGAIPNE